MGEPLVSIVIPTWNGAKTLKRVLPALLSQKTAFSFEVIIVDSESKDGTADLVQKFSSIRYFRIRKRDFNHGATRQWAAEQGKGEFIVFLTQDATPASESWLSSLVNVFDLDSSIVGAYSRQVPYSDCPPLEAERILEWYGAQRKIQYLNGVQWEELSPMERRLCANFDDVSSCIRKKILLEFPYRPMPYAEELDWAKRVLQAGKKLAYEPASIVQHSHRRSCLYEFKRRYIDHKMNRAFYDIHFFPHWPDAQRAIIAEVKQIYQKTPILSLLERIPVAMAQVLGMYLGARSIHYKDPLVLTPLERWFLRGV